MSDPVKCEHCGATGKRPRMHSAPQGWLYLETTVEMLGRPEQVITHACSQGCANALWNDGPGPRWTFEELEKLPPDIEGENAALRAELAQWLDSDGDSEWYACSTCANGTGILRGFSTKTKVAMSELKAALAAAGKDPTDGK